MKNLLWVVFFFSITSTLFSQQNEDGFVGFKTKKSSSSDKTITQDTVGFKGFKGKKIPYVNNVAKIGLTSWLVGAQLVNGELRFMYERSIAHNMTILVGGSYNFKSPIMSLLDAMSDSINLPFTIQGVRGQLAYRFFPLKKHKAPKGFYVGPHFSYTFLNFKDKNSTDEIHLNNVFGVIATGYQIITKKNVVIDFNAGIGYQQSFGSYISYSQNQKQSRTINVYGGNNSPLRYLKVMTQINIGYAF